MLQGENRLDRFLKYRAYLQELFQRQMRRVHFVVGVSHDPVAMLQSDVAKCHVLDYCVEAVRMQQQYAF